jgi:hypothetical protein
VLKKDAMENMRFKISQYACAVLLTMSSTALVAFQKKLNKKMSKPFGQLIFYLYLRTLNY